MNDTTTDPIEFLKQTYPTATWEYIPNPGNGGDALIAAATYIALDKKRCSCRHYTFKHSLKDKQVIFGGGGNLVPYYQNAADALKQARDEQVDNFVLLPHTVRGHEELLRSLDKRFVLFARDKISFNHLKTHAKNAQVYLAHDLALFLEPGDFKLPRSPVSRWKIRHQLPRKIRKNWKALYHLQQQAINKGHETFYLLRNDKEARQDIPPPPTDAFTIDLSRQLEFSENVYPAYAHLSSIFFFEAIRPFRRVITDRLHGAIASALLGKEVYFYDNSYGKNMSVYEHSLKQKFPNLHMHSDSNVTPCNS